MMRNMRQVRYAALTLGILLLPHFSKAQVITEVFYAPQSKSWIEIYNSTSASIDLTKYKILDSSVTTGHGITYASGPSQLEPGSYAVIAKDPTQFSGLSAPVFKSALAGKTSQDSFSLKDPSGNVIDTFSYSSSMGASGDGNSLQRTDTGVMAGIPTPGRMNNVASPTTSDTGTDSETSTTTDTTSQIPVVVPSSHYSFAPISGTQDQKLIVSAGRNRLGYMGIPLKFKAIINTDDLNTQYSWSFGDGFVEIGKDADHAYAYPGTYEVVLNAKLFEYESVSRIEVIVVAPNVVISEITPDYIALMNASDYEMNLYGYELKGHDHEFVFPKDTIVGAGMTVRFPESVTHLDGSVVSLVRLGSETAAHIPTPVMQQESVAEPAADASRQQAIENARKELATIVDEMNIIASAASVNAMQVKIEPIPAPVQNLAAAAATDTAVATSSTMTESKAQQSWLATVKRFFFGAQ